MSEAKFTPGPWNVSVDGDGEVAILKNASFVTYAFPTELGAGGDTKSNAHLISAAPDLYEALSDLVSSLECSEKDALIIRQEIKIARAALAKARGETP